MPRTKIKILLWGVGLWSVIALGKINIQDRDRDGSRTLTKDQGQGQGWTDPGQGQGVRDAYIALYPLRVPSGIGPYHRPYTVRDRAPPLGPYPFGVGPYR